MKKIVYITSIFLFTPVFFAHAYVFNQTLSIGSEGQDVFELQKILNQDVRTQIAEGIGSKGKEATYFGQKTKDAVIRFQNVYAQEILIPNGLSYGNGIVGKSTREVLNRLGQTNTTQTTDTVETIEPTIQQDSPTITTTLSAKEQSKAYKEKLRETGVLKNADFFVSKTTIRPREVLYIGSETPLRELDIYVGEYKMNTYCKYSEYTCAFRVKLSPGTYTLKTSNPKLGSHQITVLDKNELVPRVSIDRISLTKENIIEGKYFSPKVKVFTMYGVFESETENDSFILKFPEEYIRGANLVSEYNNENENLSEDEKNNPTLKGFFYIQNSNGLTSKARQIIYEK